MNPKRRKFWVSSLLWLIFLGPAIIYLVAGNLLITIVSFTWWLVGQAVIYKRYYVGVKPHYPLGVADQDDTYFPRFDIPRPLYLDEIKRKEREEAMKGLEEEPK